MSNPYEIVFDELASRDQLVADQLIYAANAFRSDKSGIEKASGLWLAWGSFSAFTSLPIHHSPLAPICSQIDEELKTYESGVDEKILFSEFVRGGLAQLQGQLRQFPTDKAAAGFLLANFMPPKQEQ